MSELKLMFSSACSIADPDMHSVIITGGGGRRRSKASVYDKSGWIMDLSDLRQGRYLHACTSYASKTKKVSSKTFFR